MEAANKGANRVKGKSVGLCINLPFEDTNNMYIDKDKQLNFDYFFVFCPVAWNFAFWSFVELF